MRSWQVGWRMKDYSETRVSVCAVSVHSTTADGLINARSRLDVNMPHRTPKSRLA
jgi:hypothetical protein